MSRRSLRVHGVLPALLTPFDRRGEVDEGALRRLVRFLLRKGVHGLYPCGTTGQAASLTIAQRQRVAAIVVEEAHHRVPVIVQVGLPDTASTILLARHAAGIGADGVAVVTPYYHAADDPALLAHYRAVAEALAIPVYVYNIPRNTGVNVTPALLARLAQVPGIVGIKDSSRDFTQLLEYLAVVPEEFQVICGTESYYFPAWLMGCRAGVSATANVLPELCVQLWEAYAERRYADARRLQQDLNATRPFLSTPSLAAYYAALTARGIRVGQPRPPLRALTARETQRVMTGLRGLGLLTRPA
jgi:4-hydroxy-tetrahydrodipicolinate synthase